MNCAIHQRGLRFFCVLALSSYIGQGIAQETDTTNTLATVEVKAYGQVRRLRDVPAAVGFVTSQTLGRFSPASVVQAVNTIPGVRMEERSPGSYRFNIRGSSLRSPFGVRNVKVYFNDLPVTDPGGNTYLNGFGYYNFGSIEILKGPGSSLYGAGTGGVLLLESLTTSEKAGVFGEFSTGSFGFRNAYASLTTGNEDNKSKIGFQHQGSDGYRYHSEMKRDVFNWTGNFRLGETQALKTTLLYSHLFYETPGALTKAEYDANPRAFRPAGGGFPSAEQNRASVSQNTFSAGLSYTQQLSTTIANQSVAYGMFTEMLNPAIRNYGKMLEPHTGGRTVFSYKKSIRQSSLNISAGGELQQNFSTSAVFKNAGGNADSLQTEDDIRIRQAFVFLQATVALKSWEFTAGGSLNGSTLRFRRAAPTPAAEQRKTLNDQFTPRVAVSRRFSQLTVYSSVSKGFSPPTSAELLPSGSSINLSLEAEQGINYDLGVRGTLLKNLTVDLNAFYFRLNNTIVQRRDAGGGDYYLNSGKTAQKGVETSLNYSVFQSNRFLRLATAWINHTYHHFRYKEFKQLTADFSGKALPAIAPHTVAAGLDLAAKPGLEAAITYYYSGKIPLNDANTAYADAYHLLGARLSFETTVRERQTMRLAVGADNLLDQRYSLGNDVNAFGGRYYNAAAGRNFYASVSLRLASRK